MGFDLPKDTVMDENYNEFMDWFTSIMMDGKHNPSCALRSVLRESRAELWSNWQKETAAYKSYVFNKKKAGG